MRLSVRSLISEKRSSGLLYLLLFSRLSLFLHILFNQGCDYPRWGGIMDVHEQSRIFFQGDNHCLLARFLYISDRFTILSALICSFSDGLDIYMILSAHALTAAYLTFSVGDPI